MTPKTSSGDPAVLTAAGSAMRDLSNVLARLCEDQQIAAGGRVETEVAQVEAGGGDGGFNEAFRPVAQGLLGALVSAAHQTEDGALALWMGGRAFKAADPVSRYADGVPPGADVSTRHVDPDTGAITYTGADGAQSFTVDSYGSYYTEGGSELLGQSKPGPQLRIYAPLPKHGAIPSPSVSDTGPATLDEGYPGLIDTLKGGDGTPAGPASLQAYIDSLKDPG